MKTINQFIITVLLLALLTHPVIGFPGMGENNSEATMGNITQNGQENIDLANTTQSDNNIEISLHLIEVDADLYESQNKLFVRESIVFRNRGETIFSGALKTWIPDEFEEIKVMKAQMMAETGGQPIQTVHNGNIISWQDRIEANNVPMYIIEYKLSIEPKGSIAKSKYYSKKLLYPTLINYKYIPSPGYPVFILKVSKSSDTSITLLDENRNKIIPEDFTEVNGSILDRFSEIQFKELNIELSKSAIDLSQIAIYLIIGLLIVIVLSYPVIRKKSPKLQEFEEKIRNSLKREPASEEQQETFEEAHEEEIEEELEEEHANEDEELSGKQLDKLEAEKRELLSKLDELEKDYASGNLIDEEYEELRDSYKKKLKNINRRIE